MQIDYLCSKLLLFLSTYSYHTLHLPTYPLNLSPLTQNPTLSYSILHSKSHSLSHTHIYLYTCIHIHIHINTHTHLFTHVSISTYTYACTHTHKIVVTSHTCSHFLIIFNHLRVMYPKNPIRRKGLVSHHQ